MTNICECLAILSLLLLSSCAAKKPFYGSDAIEKMSTASASHLSSDNIDYELFLVGDVGVKSSLINTSDIVMLIKSKLRSDSDNQSVVFLGNTFGVAGLPDKTDPGYAKITNDIQACIRELKDHTDKVYFIPGNHEWSDGKHYTVEAMREAEAFVENKAGGKNIVVPSGGCGEPKVVKLTDDLILVLMDSQWMLQGDDSGERKRSGCDIDDEIEFITALQGILAANKNKNVVITAHHPIYSNGLAAGNYPAKNHLLPLPIVGSLITGARQLVGSPQQFSHPQYEAYRSAMETALANFEGIITASAHDHNLQYLPKNNNHFIVAGSGNNVEHVSKGGEAAFAYMRQGFAKITHTKDLELWLEFFVPDSNNKSLAKSVFKKRLYKKEVIDFENKKTYKDLDKYPKTVQVEASDIYKKKSVGMGQMYRAEWGTTVEAPVFLLESFDGGLKPVKQGGGFQTKSIRLENPDGRQYVLRTIDKDVTKIIPVALRNTFAQRLIQNGVAAAHPYAAFAIPPMAEAVGIYHSNPKFIWLPHQKALGDYDKDFAERLYLFEERPGGNTEGHRSYGGTKKTVSTPDLIEKILKNQKHQIDQNYVLKARLFDILIGDWDRHDDQLRWGTYSDESNSEKVIYRAIPRDRDQVFFKNDGFLNYLSSRPFFNPQLRKFDDDIDYLGGVVNNARYFDRHFISQMTREDFVAAARKIQTAVSDDVLIDAFNQWPKAIYDISGPEIISKLKKRRSDLVQYAEAYYALLSKMIMVAGTNGNNVFDIKALGGDQLDVKVFHLDDGEKHLIWSRVLRGSETDELRLFGLGEKDEFNFSGDHKSSIKVRLIGGSGDDQVNNHAAQVNILAYDRPDGMQLVGSKVKSKLADKKGINRYDRTDWSPNKSIHFPMITFYTDEGVGLSYNLWWTRHGFRSKPYLSNHTLSVSYFWANQALIGKYSGHWPDALGEDWDMRLDIEGLGPTFTQYYYGIGNEYVDFAKLFPGDSEADTKDFHIVRGTQIDLNPGLIKDLKKGRLLIFNPSLEYIDLDNTPNDNESRFIYLDDSRVSADFESKLYIGLGTHFVSSRLNNTVLPTRGYDFSIGADFKQSLSDSDYSNLTVSSNVATYIPFSPAHTVVLAMNIGGDYTFGDYEFFHANYLANKSRLRGFKTNRFAGDGLVYHASDLRIKIFNGNEGLRIGLGIFGSFDYGRAFLEDENADHWHTSYGGGIYLAPLNIMSFKIGYYVGEDDTQISIGGALTF